MVGLITVDGSGRISPGDDGNLSTWSVSEAITPIAIGQPTAGTGGVSFTGSRDEEDGHYSEWTVAESATFIHEADGSASFGSIDGAISNITVSGPSASGSMSTLLQRLNAERTMPTKGSYTEYSGTVLPNPSDLNASAVIGQPGNMAFDSSGAMFIVDRSTGRVVKFTQSGGAWVYSAATAAIGAGFGTGNGQFSASATDLGLAIAADNTVYVTDPGNNRVQKFTNALAYSTQFGSPGTGNGQFNLPYGIAINDAGNIFIADSGNHRIQRFTSSHVYELKWGTEGDSESKFTLPYKLASEGNRIYVADLPSVAYPSSARVHRFSSTGTPLGLLHVEPFGATANPFSIAVSPSTNRMYVVDITSNSVRRYTFNFIADGSFGSFGAGAGQLLYGRAVAVAPSGQIYVSDFGTGRVLAYVSAITYTQPLSEYFRDYLELVIPGVYDPLPTPSRTNWPLNPSPQDATITDTGWSHLGSPATAGRQAGQGVGGGYGYVVTWSGTDAGTDSGGGYISSLSIPEPNTPMTPSIYVKLDIAAASRVLQLRITFSNSGGTLSSEVSNPVTVSDGGSFTRLVGSPTYVPVGTETISITAFNPYQSSDPWVSGDKLILDQVSTASGDYFDGTTAPANGRIIQWAGAPYASSSEEYQRGYIYESVEDPEVIYPGWRDNVWTKLNELCAATHRELSLVGGVITVRDAGDLTLTPGSDIASPSISVDTLNLARAVDIVYQNVDYGDGVVMYDARADNNRIFSIASGKVETFVITTNSYPVVLNNPTPVESFLIGPGQYHVIGSDNLPVDPEQWMDYGGSVEVSIGDNPNDIEITLTGPTAEIPGVPGPYSLAASDGSSTYATLSIAGSGVSTNPRTLHLYTGADPNLVTQETQTTITNIHITDLAAAYDRGVWASDLACGPNVTLSATLGFPSEATETQIFGLFPGRLVRYADSRYRITTTSVQNANVSFTAVRHVTSGNEEDAWDNLATITNRSENPSVEVSTAGFVAGTLTTITQSSTWASSGTYSLRLSTTSNAFPVASVGSSGPGSYTIPWGMIAGRTYTISADVHSVFPGAGSWLAEAGRIMVYYGRPGASGLLGFSDPLDTFTIDARPSVTFTIPPDATGVRIDFYATGIGTNWYAYWDAFLLTEGVASYEFFDGSTAGATWAGTAGLSASSKAPNSAGDYAAFWNGEPAKNAIIRPLRVPED